MKPFFTPTSQIDYAFDAWQRSVLFLDVLRNRGDQYREHIESKTPHVLVYDFELISDGAGFPRPVNYKLVRILPPEGVEIDPAKRPFVVIDPRAGHGPGIGGFKADSEIGVALEAGHPTYFIGFTPEPVPGQTIEDVARAEARFIEIVIERHPDAAEKPCVIGNCQAGWAVPMLAAVRPELFGPMILPGAPLSYWAGVRGKNPMRYSGGLLGGTWLTSLTSDLGAGIFDGAWLVFNFENQNPANTYWKKQYNVYANVDTEPERYLGFERWWGGHVLLGGEEMQWITDNLFVGNKLSAGMIRTSDGEAVDLRNIKSPIVIFCSWGDNITPPQQALDWILDAYDDVAEIRARGQTIVYTIHDQTGHLGIFVSGSIARKQHAEFASNIDMIDILPPGLYEAVLTTKTPDMDGADMVGGDWLMRCERRDLDDIRALGHNDIEDDKRFETVARMSEVNLALYRTFARPFVQAMSTAPWAQAMRQLHPSRVGFEAFSSANPFLWWVEPLAEQVRQNRRPVAKDNPFLALQERGSDQIEQALDNWRVAVERMSEKTFMTVFGNPALQSAFGVDPNGTAPPRKAAKSVLSRELVAAHEADLRSRMAQGGVFAALIRALLYIRIPSGTADERGFAMIRRLRRLVPEAKDCDLQDFKAALREQFEMLHVDESAAMAAFPELLPDEPETRSRMLELLREVLDVTGDLDPEGARRFAEISDHLEEVSDR
ncbi:DUF3141 domain-containing protein [Sedimentitalea arenosa]|uniref:DUF3141 domain-containing protein n=1 Tax=Sedimentitalea arenosa TaxID=2798803 RepID=A0A8J7IV44_9RHOB|nr:DUF3141 domain-containing protein [Arenibacterium arenosum]MBJ6373456.1 DUF3141 domain-containing protein [Arenibacterium arenosum]